MDSKHIPYYFNEIQKIFFDCSQECQTCNGTMDSNCLSCRDVNDSLYKGKCYSQCPDKTYHITVGTIENKFCEDCYQSCEKCLISGNNTYMNCLNCPRKSYLL